MLLKFLWGDGQLDYGPINLNHVNLVQRMGGTHPEQFVGGVYNSDSGVFSSIYGKGVHPKEEELRFMLEWDMMKYESGPIFQAYAANVEDTEPEFNLSFLDDPKKELYEPAWENGKMKPEAKAAIKNHVLDALRAGGYPDADDWIYFTVFGSGASYNWDEDGDFDVQMWVDVDKYNSTHETPTTSDELVTAVRSIVQPVNFPSFTDLNLDNGKMLIQFYPQPGTGSKDENEAKKPYACYDMETDEWIVKPKPYTADFYGQHFLAIQSKANDIASQAETLLNELQRNTLSFQFWSGLWSKYKNDHYLDAAEDAQDKAELNKEGIATLFEGVFGGRQQAYSPEGKGIEDERDATQKLLEVWGIFQKLKHYARAPLPWDEQEMPESPDKKESMWKEAMTEKDIPSMGAWGYINGHLVIATMHHQGIMMALINNGWTWEELMNAPQAWGWYSIYGKKISISFSSDAGFITAGKEAIEAWKQMFPDNIINAGMVSEQHGVTDADSYGSGISGKEHQDFWKDEADLMQAAIRTPIPPPPSQTGQTLPPPTLPGGGVPPPKKVQSYEVTYETEEGSVGHVVLTAKSPMEAMQKAEKYFAQQGDNITALDAKISSVWKEAAVLDPNDYSYGSFGYVNGHLMLGQFHHQAIMGALMNHGWSFEDLMNATQAWGWWEVVGSGTHKHIDVRFSSDAGYQHTNIFDDVENQFEEYFGIPAQREHFTKSIEDTGKEYGQGLAGKGNLDYYLNKPDAWNGGLFKQTPIPPPPGEEEPQHEQLKLFDHPVPGGGAPPPKKTPVQLNIGDKIEITGPDYAGEEGWIGEVGTIRDDMDDDGDYHVELADGENSYFSADNVVPHSSTPVTTTPTKPVVEPQVPPGYETVNLINAPKAEIKKWLVPGQILVGMNENGGELIHQITDVTSYEVSANLKGGTVPNCDWSITDYIGFLQDGDLAPVKSQQEEETWEPNLPYEKGAVKFLEAMKEVGTSIPTQIKSMIDYLNDYPVPSPAKEKLLTKLFGKEALTPGGGTPPPKKINFQVGDKFKTGSGEIWEITSIGNLVAGIQIYSEDGKPIQKTGLGLDYLSNVAQQPLPFGIEKINDTPTTTPFQVGEKFDTSTGYTWTITEINGNVMTMHWKNNNTGNDGQTTYTVDQWQKQVDQGIVTKDGPGFDFNSGEFKFTNVQKFAQWQDLMEKAQRLRANGQVQITVNQPDHVVGTVQGDHGTYQTEIWRDDPSSQAITMWDCECPWSQYSWGRTRQWKKYEGRPCAHTLALFWQAQSQPPQQPDQTPEQAPPVPTPGGGMQPQQGLISPVPIPNVTLPVTDIPGQGVPPPGGPVQPQTPEPTPTAYSQPTTPQNAQGVIAIPGALSHVKTSVEYGENNFNPQEFQQWIQEHGPLFYHLDRSGGPYTGQPGQDNVPNITQQGLIPGKANHVFLGSQNLFDMSEWNPEVWGSYPQYMIDARSLDPNKIIEFHLNGRYVGDGKIDPFAIIRYDGVIPPQAVLFNPQEKHRTVMTKTATFENGQHVRCRNDVVGEDTVTNKEYIVPQNSAGTVLYSDSVETVVIFPLKGGILSPHLVKVEGLTYEFYADEAVNPFIKRRRSAWA